MRNALIIVDVQNDFCPGGALAVSEGDQIVPVLNRYIKSFEKSGDTIVATRDWHPQQTRHFVSGGGIWPPHCVQGTRGADFHPALKLPANTVLVSKGMSPDSDSYSGFDAVTDDETELAEALRSLGVERVFVAGLATDYCVKHTVLDALRQGFKVIVLRDAIRGVNLQPDDSTRALQEMIDAGAELRGEAEIHSHPL
ncbi:MAG TPA: bifunctional nicotinamidase/pyrazinamidase [Candidatus Binatia bacterium]|jgi:nicotinamidase/pyrazinamidase